MTTQMDRPGGSGNGVTLRPANICDCDFLFECYASSRDDEMAHAPWDAATKSIFLRAQFEAQQRHYEAHYTNATRYIACVDGEPIGMLWLARGEHEIRLMDMVILSAARNRGHGSQLLGIVLAEAAQTQKCVSLHVWQGNPRASRLYTRFGFAPVSTDGMHVRLEWQSSTSSKALPPRLCDDHSNSGVERDIRLERA
jgi:ribosomal protein S18 acetylase RimI-like enzyme